MSKSSFIVAATILIGSAGATFAGDLPVTADGYNSPAQFILHSVKENTAVFGLAKARELPAQRTSKAFQPLTANEMAWMQQSSGLNSSGR